ncbi:MAG: KEOPS complex kinase/ATPase Bud32, partial [Halorhabdus sp.]
VLGAKMYAAGDTIAIEDSTVRPDFRPDEVPVTWRSGEAVGSWAGSGDDEAVGAWNGGAAGDAVQGAEATVTVADGRVRKQRNPRAYRHPTLDERLRTERTREEARLTSEARRVGVPTPVVYDVDPGEGVLVFEPVGDRDLRESLTPDRVRDVGRHLATIHDAGFVHGDPTTRNVRVGEEYTYLIDFGLGYYTGHAEDHAMDLHVFAQSLAGTADDAVDLQKAAEDAYRTASERGDRILDRLREIEGRGRYQ